MAVTKTIAVGGKDVTFRASAAIPRLYRNKFHRDIYRDLNELQKGIDENSAGESNLDTFSLELFENIAWLMARHADSAVPDSPEEWLDGLTLFLSTRCFRKSLNCGASTRSSRSSLKKTSRHGKGDDNAAVPAPVCADRAFHFGARPAHHRDGERYVCGNVK